MLIAHGSVSLDWRATHELKVQHQDLWGTTFLLNQGREETGLQLVRLWNDLIRPTWEDLRGATFLLNSQSREEMDLQLIRLWNCLILAELSTVNQAWTSESGPMAINTKLWMDCTWYSNRETMSPPQSRVQTSMKTQKFYIWTSNPTGKSRKLWMGFTWSSNREIMSLPQSRVQTPMKTQRFRTWTPNPADKVTTAT